jgi:TonB family protein
MFFRILSAALILIAWSQFAVLAQSGDLERELIDQFRGKVITLRTFSKSNHLEFGPEGNLKKPGETGSWTVYSQLLVRKIDLSGSLLRLIGDRIIHHYDENRKQMVASRSDLTVELDAQLKKGATSADIAETMKKILVGPEGLSPYVSEYWRPYLENKKPPILNCASAKSPIRVGGNALAANLIKQVKPQYTPEGKSFLLQGVVVLEAVITETGDVGNLAVVSPAGAGFDESAVEAVSQWKYKPVLLQGQPVCVVTTITVNYAVSR